MEKPRRRHAPASIQNCGGCVRFVPSPSYEDCRRSERECRRGDLKGNLKMDFGTLRFDMWQDVANVENRNGGRYDFGKEKRMPYMLRLLMEHTRRRLREYTSDTNQAGRYRRPELNPYLGDADERDHLRGIPVM